MFVKRNERKFLVAAFEQMVQELDNLIGVERKQTTKGMRPNTQPSERYHYKVSSGPGVLGAEGANGSAEKDTLGAISPNTIFSVIWQASLMSSSDLFPGVDQAAQIVVDYVHLSLYRAHLASTPRISLKRFPAPTYSLTLPTNSILESKRPAPGPTKAEGYFATFLRRSANIAASSQQMALGHASGEAATTNSAPAAPETLRGNWLANGVAERSPEWNRLRDTNDPQSLSTSYCTAKEPITLNFHARGFDSS